MSGVEAGASRHSIVDYGLAGRAAVVTGAATGIGAATAGLLADLGVSVVIADVNEAAGTLTANAIDESGGQARFIACDVSDEDAVRRAIDAAVATYGGIDIVVNCAAAMPLVSSDRDVVQAEVTHWDRMFAVNLRGQMLTCKHAIPGMLRRGGGSIVNISSAAAMAGLRGVEGCDQPPDYVGGHAVRTPGHPVQRHRARTGAGHEGSTNRPDDTE
jgi:NAD(P)-dependent dehydrogenase (short-subunit alcohol dehydrogenase family)